MRYLILSAFTIVLLAGCSQLPSQPSAQTEQALNQTPPPEQWAVTAKLGIKVPQQSGSVSLFWQQMDTSYRIRVQGPLGQGSAMIYGNEERIVIKRPGKPLLTSSNANGLIEETFGWSFPLNDLKFWVRGMPAPDTTTATEQQGPSGVLESLQQSQWAMTYSRYQTVDQWQLPGKIVAQNGDTRLTLIIRKWKLL